MKKVIITGATGFIGGALAKKLLSDGVTVYGIDIDAKRLEQMKQYGDFIPVVADFSKYDKLSEMITDKDIDVFYHFAWAGKLGGQDLYDYKLQISNTLAACKSCEFACSINVKRFVFISSSYQFMVDNKTNSTNSNIYGIEKNSAQLLCKAICYTHNAEFIGAILTNTYGNGDYSKKAVNTFIRKLLNNENLDLITGEYQNDWMYIDETVRGLIYVGCTQYEKEEIYIGHSDISTFKEKLIIMKKVLNSESELNFGCYQDNAHVDYKKLIPICINQAEIKMQNFEEYINLTAKWIKQIDCIEGVQQECKK